VIEALCASGIEARHTDAGTQRLACPECAMVKHRTRDSALALTIQADGCAVWLCHRCGFKGGTSGDAWRDAYSREQTCIDSPQRQARRAELIQQADRTLRIKRERHATRAEKARAIWRAAGPASADHPYLAKKRLPPLGLREVGRFQSIKNALLVPMRDATGAIVNLQAIGAGGEKRFLAGAQTRCAFACVGAWQREAVPEMLAIGEGWSTVTAFVVSHPGYHGIAALSASNLLAVAECIHEKFLAARISVLCDQDPVGVRAATVAQLAVGADMMAPGFRHVGVNDFSDLWERRAP